MKIADVLKSLVEYGRFSEWFGLSSGFSLRKVADRAFLHGCIDKFWTTKALETIIAPFRTYATKEGLTEKVIDTELDYFAKKLVVELNLLRRVYYRIGEAEPKDSSKLEEPELDTSEKELGLEPQVTDLEKKTDEE
jgi:hypothetical protein